jgi:hypothetical protein
MKRLDALVIALILAAAVAATVFMSSAGGRAAAAGDLRAEIYEDGVLTRVLQLYVESEIVVNAGGGYNRVVVENGSVRVAEADCGSRVCVHSGAKALPGDMIACLPHRLLIKIGGGEAPYDVIAY